MVREDHPAVARKAHSEEQILFISTDYHYVCLSVVGLGWVHRWPYPSGMYSPSGIVSSRNGGDVCVHRHNN